MTSEQAKPNVPAAIVSSITWGQSRKRPGPIEYSMDEQRAEVTMLIPDGVRKEEAIEQAKAIVKLMLGPEPQQPARVQSPNGSGMGPATPRASSPPAHAATHAQRAPASFSPRGRGGPPRAKPCKYECGTLIVWDNDNRLFLDAQTYQPHRCG